MSGILVDDRYRGEHGIGRYASEVLPRLRVDWQPLGIDGDQHSPFDAFRRLPSAVRDTVVYSPGYAALARAPRMVLTIHDLIHLQVSWPHRAKFVAYYNGPVRQTVRRAGVVLTVSETSASAIREWVRDDAVEVVNAGNGCSAAFHPDGPSVTEAQPYLLFVGNLREHKNLDVVLRALVAATDVRVKAVIPAREVAAARAMAATLGVRSRVDWITGVDDERLAELYRGAAATLMPSTLEGFGLPALESVACGTPVVHWRGCAAVAEIVGAAGIAVDSATGAGEWADAMRAASGSPRRVAGPVGSYDWDRTAGVVNGVLARVAGRRSGR